MYDQLSKEREEVAAAAATEKFAELIVKENTTMHAAGEDAKMDG